jgi:predicted DNA-binding transcriptional regulator AlpA
MRIPADLLPQKAVADDLCVSLVTLWRARNSELPDFPEPVILKNRMVFWKKSDLGRLEDALLKFRGRNQFEKLRKVHRASKALKRAKKASPGRATEPTSPGQKDLFD